MRCDRARAINVRRTWVRRVENMVRSARPVIVSPSAWLLTAAIAVVFVPDAAAQSVGDGLGTLLTEQRPSGGLIPDANAAAVTPDTVSGLFLTELATLPVSSSSGGFVYRVNRQLGLVERASDAFGPFYTDRVLRNSRGQLTLGIGYQANAFSSLQRADLESGTFTTNATRLAGSDLPFGAGRTSPSSCAAGRRRSSPASV